MKSRVFVLGTGCAWLSVMALVISSSRGSESAPPADEVQSNPAAPAEASDVPSAASPAEIAAWILELEDNRYLVREQASRRLLAAGMPALDPLLDAANGKGPERADRALWILRKFSGAKDAVLRRQALERLVRVKDRPRVSAAAVQALAVMRHQEAVAAIDKLGGRFTSPQFGNQNSTEPYRTVFVVLDNQWRGGDAGLSHLGDLLGLQQVIIVGTDVSLAGLAELQKIQQLERLWLYGTRLEPEDLPKVQAVLPQVALDYRRGGLLGVGGNTLEGTGPAVVSTVQKDSAAEAAGIKVGDVIQQFNGQPVGSFKELTTKIGQLRAGDEVKLDVLREGKPIAFTIKLGQWRTF